ncbi:MAG TPA: hypothetical protein VGF33_05620 [Caulobacteraceae bacterium]|jgi:hypothetical protein
MSDVASQAPAPAELLLNGALPQRRGRPKGATNLRSRDLGRYIEAMYGGMTPGQQAAAVALISPADVEAAPEAARDLGLVDLGLDPVTLAMAVKAKRLAKALGCEAFEAWALMAKERDGLMRYVHQVQPPAKDGANRPPATVYVIPEGEVRDAAYGALPDDSQDPDFPELFGPEETGFSREGSHDDEKAE